MSMSMSTMRCLALATLSIALLSRSMHAAPVDLTTLQELTYQPTDGFAAPDWRIVDAPEYDMSGNLTGNIIPVAAELNNSYPTLLHTPSDVPLGSRISYIWRPGTDDDLSGFVLGIDPGTPESPASEDPSTRFLLFDWKRVEQSFDFTDPLTGEGNPGDFINDSTEATTAPAVFRAAWVEGVPSADELWGKQALPSVGSFPDTGGVALISEGSNVGTAGYNANGENQQYVVDIEYSADRVLVKLDGVEEFNFTPADVPGSGLTQFPEGRFGFYESHQSPGGIYTKLDIRPIGETPELPTPLNAPPTPVLSSGVKAFMIDATNEDAAVDPASWSVVASSEGSNKAFIVSPPNNGDVDFVFGPDFNPTDVAVQLGLKASPASITTPEDGVLFATVAQNGGRMRDDPNAAPIYGTAEAPGDSGFGGVRGGFAVAEVDGSESTTRVAGAFFPYEKGGIGFTAGIVNADGSFESLNSEFPAPTVVTTDATGLYKLQVAERDANSDGFLLAVGGANNNNVVGASPNVDGTWSISVRDNRARGGDEDFEDNRFNYVYLDKENTEGLIAGLVTDFDTGGNAELGMAVGDFALVREDVGQYRLSLVSDTPDDGVLLLTNAEMTLLSDQTTLAPGNFYLTYEADGSDFTIQMRQLVEGSAPVPVDGDFTFAFVGYDGRLAAIPEPTSIALGTLALVFACTTQRRRRFRSVSA